MKPLKPLRLGALACALGVLPPALAPRTALADEPSFDGLWSMSDVTETFVVQEWGAPCGPPPVSGTMLTAGPMALHSEGGEIVLASDRRTLRTDACLDAMPSLVRETHSRDGRSWRTRCSTPPNDPRHAVVNTAFFIAPGDDTIAVAETGRYEFTISSERCVADVKRAASLSRLLATAPGSSTRPTRAVPLPEATAVSGQARADCSSPGEPTRLEVRPSRKLLRLGEVFAFHARVVDAAGCATPIGITWTVGPVHFKGRTSHAARPAIDSSGRLAVPEADFGDATFEVVATAAGRSASATVEATSPQNFEGLLAHSGLDSNGERDEPAVAILATSSIGASRTRAEDGAARRRDTFIAIVAGLASLLGIVAFVGARRARKSREAERAAQKRHAEKMREYERQKRDREQQHADQMRAHVQSVAIAQQQAAAAAARGVATGPAFCPSCRREFPAGTAFCPFDSNRLVAIAGHEELLAGPTGGICPVCKRGYNPGVRQCPHDGEELVPSSVADLPPAVASPPNRGKICPTCGARFEGTAAFCGKDGTQLVLLN